jgi:sodium/bile acid cotransporter 7
MTAMAGGNVPLSLFICVLGNFAAILTIPFMLNLILALTTPPSSCRSFRCSWD